MNDGVIKPIGRDLVVTFYLYITPGQVQWFAGYRCAEFNGFESGSAGCFLTQVQQQRADPFARPVRVRIHRPNARRVYRRV